MRLASLALLALLSVAPIGIPTTPAAAQTQTSCVEQIASLRAATTAVAISGKNAERDRESLLRTLDAASTELAKGKNADAAKKLSDFRIKVEQLAGAGRISATDAASLTAQTDSAIACLNGSAAG